MIYGGDLRPNSQLFVAEEGLHGIDRLLAIELIKRTQALYCFNMDTKDWDNFEVLFVPEAVLEIPFHGTSDDSKRVEGRRQIRRFVETAVTGVATIHQCHTPIMEFPSDNNGRVTWAMEDM
ncbi:conserved hypothetical protein [Burkholderia sp. H160]|nr:conserved hypothetical protein [Burkholderia sp. H160]